MSTSDSEGVAFDLLRHGAKLEGEFFGSLFEIVSVKLLDVFKIGGQEHEGVES